VTLTDDVEEARRIGRKHLEIYLGFPNYVNNWKRLGFTDDDVTDGGSDRLVDAMVVAGSVDRVAERVREHHDAGADHVSRSCPRTPPPCRCGSGPTCPVCCIADRRASSSNVADGARPVMGVGIELSK